MASEDGYLLIQARAGQKQEQSEVKRSVQRAMNFP